MKRPAATAAFHALALPLLAVALGTCALFASACGKDHDGDPAGPGGDAGAEAAAPLETVAPAIIPRARRKDAASSAVVFDTTRGGVWTANGDVGTLSYVDIDVGRVVAEVPIGREITTLALSPDARWIAAVDRGGGAVSLVDAESRTVRATLPVGGHPRAVVWDTASPQYFYVSVEDDDAVVLVDRTVPAILARIPVGHLPSGLATSRLRREVYVTHRVDPAISIVDLKDRVKVAAVPLEAEAPTKDAKVPHGAPFAFESLAWAPDGKTAWVPHELIAGTRPFQFQSTLFPAVSVVDLDGRAEVETDPSTGVIDGRKNLFDAIQLLDDTGDTAVVSQPCAAAFHPNGILVYVLACASEDLLVFDTTQGIAVNMLRDLPGDHPVGLALDDTGQRAWVLSDQSHTLVMVDLAGGSPIRQPTVRGAPILVAANDPVEPELREGLKLWFRANSAKGTLPTTGNNWMACGGCHLDGLVSSNLGFFAALAPTHPGTDARIGHVGLTDLFSTSPAPTDARFSPHDLLVAMTDQGGLAPDRSGARRAGAIDPSAPTAEAKTIASRLARVLSRDLPAAPSWLLAGDAGAPNTEYDSEWCGRCHATEYEAWKSSLHAEAARDPMVLYGVGVEQQARGPQYSRLCAGCHDPVSARMGDVAMTSKRGITCLGCHDITRLIRAGGNADLEATSHDWTQSHALRAAASLDTLRKPEFCGGCHEQFVPGTGLLAIDTLGEYQHSVYAGKDGKLCVDCHMPRTNGKADHRSPGGNVYMARTLALPGLEEAQAKLLGSALAMWTERSAGAVVVHVTNAGAGHAFPTGVTDIREPWLEVQALDAAGKVLARYGGPDGAGLLPPLSARFGIDVASADGTLLLRHELSESTRIPFARTIAAKETQTITIPLPTTLPPGTSKVEAVMLYRNVRTPYFRAATGDTAGASPDVVVTRAAVE